MVDSPLVYRGERIKKVNDRKERILGSDGGEVDREAKRRRGRSLAFRACVRDEVGRTGGGTRDWPWGGNIEGLFEPSRWILNNTPLSLN